MNENISELLDKEIEKIKALSSPSKDAKLRLDLIDKTSKEVLSKLEEMVLSDRKNIMLGSLVFDGLLGLLESDKFKGLSLDSANLIFNQINEGLERKKMKTETSESDFNYISWIQKDLETAVLDYLKQKFVLQLKEFDLPKRLSLLKKTYDKTNYVFEFQQKALVEMQDETEYEIAIQKAELTHQKELKELTNQDSRQEKTLKHKDLTIHRAILLMKHLAPRLSGADQNKVAEVVAFLTGLDRESIRQGYSEIKNKFFNKPEAYNKDVKIVCKYLNLVGLTNEAEKLKKDSGVI